MIVEATHPQGAKTTQRVSVSVVICAYADERWPDLLRAVDSIRSQTRPACDTLLVIDHNPKLFERAQHALPGVRVVENQGPRGLSGGRNTGIALAQGDVVAFLDDDAEAAPDWLQHLTRWFEDSQVAGAGGRVEPRWETQRPAWLPREFDWVIGCSYRGLPETSGPVRNLFGGCMVVRRHAFELAGGFQSAMGRGQGRPMGCEETELCIRIHQRRPDWRFIYDPEAWAYHRVPSSRGRWQYFLSRCYAEGLSKAQVSQLVGSRDGLAAERAYTRRTLPHGLARGVVDAFARGDWTGLLRASAIVVGLSYTVLGYGIGLAGLWLRQRQP